MTANLRLPGVLALCCTAASHDQGSNVGFSLKPTRFDIRIYPAEQRHAQAAANLHQGVIMFQRMDHVGLSVRDMEKAIAFYRDVIGMEKEISQVEGRLNIEPDRPVKYTI